MGRPMLQRTKDIIEFCATPRTMKEIQGRFGSAPEIETTVNRCVVRGYLFNHRAGINRNTYGVYCIEPKSTKPTTPMEKYWHGLKARTTT